MWCCIIQHSSHSCLRWCSLIRRWESRVMPDWNFFSSLKINRMLQKYNHLLPGSSWHVWFENKRRVFLCLTFESCLNLIKFEEEMDSQARHDLLALKIEDFILFMYWERSLITDAPVNGARSTPVFAARKCSFLRMCWQDAVVGVLAQGNGFYHLLQPYCIAKLRKVPYKRMFYYSNIQYKKILVTIFK